MPDFVVLMKLTDQGARTMSECPEWVRRWQEGWESYGGTWKSFHVTAGDYDCVLVAEAESEDHVAAFAMWLAQEGNVTTTTMRAWSVSYIVEWAPGMERGYPK
jgi:uncharacterized protein with GYD domain